MVSITRMLVMRKRTMRLAQVIRTSVDRKDTVGRPAGKRTAGGSHAARAPARGVAESERGTERDHARERQRPAEPERLADGPPGERAGEHDDGVEQALGGIGAPAQLRRDARLP